MEQSPCLFKGLELVCFHGYIIYFFLGRAHTSISGFSVHMYVLAYTRPKFIFDVGPKIPYSLSYIYVA